MMFSVEMYVEAGMDVMAGRIRYKYAAEMLKTTNVFHRAPEEICYSIDDEKRSLTDLLYEIPAMKEPCKKLTVLDKEKCFIAIYESMEEFLESYPACFSLRQRFRFRFREWLERILTKYDVQGVEIPDSFTVKDRDTVVALAKQLHAREGVTKAQMSQALGIKERGLLKDLRKLDPALRESSSAPDDGQELFDIGGQPVKLQIRSFRMPGERARRYQTVNTMHPLILQENVMQVGVLIQSLARNYMNYESEISVTIGVDIWNQLSDYGKERVRSVFAAGDPAVSEFIDIIDNDFPDDNMAGFFTERQMYEEYSASTAERILFYMKAERRCDLKLFTDHGIEEYQSVKIRPGESIPGNDGEDVSYEAHLSDGGIIRFTKEMIDSIE